MATARKRDTIFFIEFTSKIDFCIIKHPQSI